MVLDKLGNSLKSIFDKLAGAMFLDKKTVDAALDELKFSLIESDVDLQIVEELTGKVRDFALSEKIKGIDKKEQVVKLIHDEIVRMLGSEKHELKIEKPCRIMLLGLYGAGKTTTLGKLALYYSKRGHKVCMLGLDVHRPAASEQLEQIGKKINVQAFVNKEEKNPFKILEQFESQISKYDLCLVDTAGRDALNSELIQEIKKIHDSVQPSHSILVMPADIGQAARRQVEEFRKFCSISGVIITRMDGTAKAGGALVACSETSSPVLFIGTGEHMQDIEQFSPTAFVSRILGLGDIEALLEKVKTASEPKSELKGKFTLYDFYEQIKSVQNLGALDKITSMLPLGKVKLPAEMLNMQQEKMKRWKYAIDSMTKEEVEHPELLEKQTARLSRIAKGAGVTTSDIRDLIAQYKLSSEMLGKGSKLVSEESLKSGNLDMAEMSRQMKSLGLSNKQLMKLAKRFKNMM